MKTLNLSLFLYLFLTLSSLSYAEGNLKISATKPPTAILHNDFPNIFRPIGNFFKRIVGIKPKYIYCPPPASVRNLTLSKTEIGNCLGNTSCSETNHLIQILTETNQDKDAVVTYVYEVTGGKIIGKGAQVEWDLSNEKTGIYKITAWIDDGCGYCGQSVTKEIKVVECADCQ